MAKLIRFLDNRSSSSYIFAIRNSLYQQDVCLVLSILQREERSSYTGEKNQESCQKYVQIYLLCVFEYLWLYYSEGHRFSSSYFGRKWINLQLLYRFPIFNSPATLQPLFHRNIRIPHRRSNSPFICRSIY